MPYIDDSERALLDPHIERLSEEMEMGFQSSPQHLKKAGRLNYVVSRLMVLTLPEKRYWALALAIGTVFCAILEFYRRFVGPYEDDAIQKNGDIKEYQEKKV